MSETTTEQHHYCTDDLCECFAAGEASVLGQLAEMVEHLQDSLDKLRDDIAAVRQGRGGDSD